MVKLFKELLKTPVIVSLLFWGTDSISQIFLHYYWGYYEPFWAFDIWVLAGSALFCSFNLGTTESMNFLRQTSKSIRHFWKLRILLFLSAILFNLMIFALKSVVYEPGFWKQLGYSMSFLFWIMLASLMILFVLTSKNNYQKEIQSFNKPIMAIAMLCGFYGWSGVLFFVLTKTVLGFFALLLLSAWTVFLVADTHAVETLYPKIRKRIWIFGKAIMVFLVVVSIVLFSNKLKEYSIFLGVLGPSPKPWVFAEIDKVKDLKDWMDWYKSADRSVTVKEAILALEKLSSFCIQKILDNPLEIGCVDEKIDRSFNILKQEWSVSESLDLIKSSNPYAQLVGLFYIRTAPRPFPQEIIETIKPFTSKPGPLSTVALSTLEKDSAVSGWSIKLIIKSGNKKKD